MIGRKTDKVNCPYPRHLTSHKCEKTVEPTLRDRGQCYQCHKTLKEKAESSFTFVIVCYIYWSHNLPSIVNTMRLPKSPIPFQIATRFGRSSVIIGYVEDWLCFSVMD